MAAGMLFLLSGLPGFWDYLVYAFDSVRGVPVTQPAPAFQWPQYAGMFLFLTGVAIKFKDYSQREGAKQKEAKTKFKEEYLSLSDVRLQDEFERLYNIKYASVKAIKNVLGHGDNKNLVIALFEKAHPNIEVCDDWFKLRGKFIPLRYKVGFFLWCGIPLLTTIVFIMGVLEFFVPGVTQSGQEAIYAYAAMFIAFIMVAIIFYQDLMALGYAITLVEKYRPEK